MKIEVAFQQYSSRGPASSNWVWPLPRPDLVYDEKLNLVIAAVPWGERQFLTRFHELLRERIESPTDSIEPQDRSEAGHSDSVLSSGSMVQHLQSHFDSLEQRLASHLRAVHLKLLEEFNTEDYRAGAEVLVGQFERDAFIWAQIGGPSMWVRNSYGLVPLGNQSSLLGLSPISLEKDTHLPLIPVQMLGVFESTRISSSHIPFRNGQSLYFVQHPSLNLAQLAEAAKSKNLTEMVGSLARDSATPHSAFWLAEVKRSA